MEKKKYCFVCEIKDGYVDKLKNMVMTQGKERLLVHKECGMNKLLQWIYKNILIVYIEGDEISKVEEKLSKMKIITKWDKITYPMMDVKYAPAEKICDLNQQLEGTLKKY